MLNRDEVDAAISRLVNAHLSGQVTDAEYRYHGRMLGWAWWQAMGWGKVVR